MSVQSRLCSPIEAVLLFTAIQTAAASVIPVRQTSRDLVVRPTPTARRQSGESMSNDNAQASDGEFQIRTPTVEDGAALWRLVTDVGTLDRNSSYLYLLVCRDFADTCVVAERGGELLGFVTGYRPPAERDVVFVWQVGVSERARGLGLASALLDALLLSSGCRGVRFMETTVTPSNRASRAMFQSLARRLDAELAESAGFDAELFPDAGHEPERRLRIGPFDASILRNAE